MSSMVRVVIADDDSSFSALIRRWLEKAGHEPLVCANGAEALGSLVEGLPTVVLMDWDIPELDGLEVCRRIRASPLSSQTHVILITANGEEGGVLAAFDAGADDYLVKPCKRGELLARIHSAERVLKALYEKHQRENELAEIVKELDCLYALSKLVQRRDISLEETLQQAAELIPPALQHSEIACARIVVGETRLQTGNYAKSKWKLTCDISANGKVVGAVEVGYLKERPELDEGPFLREERDLLNAISEQLGRTIELRWAEQGRARALERQVDLNRLQQELLGPDTLKNKLGRITGFVVSAFGADFCRVWITQPGDRCEAGCIHAKVTEGPHVCLYRERCLHLLASSGRYTHIDGEVHRRVPFGCYKIGRVAADQDVKFLTNQVTTDPRVHHHDWAKELGLVAFAGYQLRPPGGDTIGVMALFSRHAISPEEDALLETVAHATAQVIQAARIEQEREELHKQLMDVSRQAGMAEVATGVLHNVGNVLNSVNVSATIVGDKLRQSHVHGVSKAAALMQNHAGDLGAFMTADQKGRQLPGYLAKLGEHLAHEQAAMLDELASLCRNIEHIKDVVSMQQGYARMAGIAETFPITEPIENALRLNEPSFERHGINVVREYEDTPQLVADRHRVLQILINLVRNAEQALRDSQTPDRCLKVRVRRADGDRVRVEVIDNGVGIPVENMGRIFSHGFTTKPDGHGFGLHNSALAAKEMDGSLTAYSDGPGRGATFVLELPLRAGEQGAVGTTRKTWRPVRAPETASQ